MRAFRGKASASAGSNAADDFGGGMASSNGDDGLRKATKKSLFGRAKQRLGDDEDEDDGPPNRNPVQEAAAPHGCASNTSSMPQGFGSEATEAASQGKTKSRMGLSRLSRSSKGSAETGGSRSRNSSFASDVAVPQVVGAMAGGPGAANAFGDAAAVYGGEAVYGQGGADQADEAARQRAARERQEQEELELAMAMSMSMADEQQRQQVAPEAPSPPIQSQTSSEDAELQKALELSRLEATAATRQAPAPVPVPPPSAAAANFLDFGAQPTSTPTAPTASPDGNLMALLGQPPSAQARAALTAPAQAGAFGMQPNPFAPNPAPMSAAPPAYGQATGQFAQPQQPFGQPPQQPFGQPLQQPFGQPVPQQPLGQPTPQQPFAAPMGGFGSATAFQPAQPPAFGGPSAAFGAMQPPAPAAGHYSQNYAATPPAAGAATAPAAPPRDPFASLI